MVKFKKLHENAVLPSRVHIHDGGLDITATTKQVTKEYIEYGTGLATHIPEGHVGLLFPRSSVTKTGLMLKNCVGVLDASYRGEIKFRFQDVDRTLPAYEVGQRIGQLVIVPILTHDAEWVDDLPSSSRGSGGYGSTGV